MSHPIRLASLFLLTIFLLPTAALAALDDVRGLARLEGALKESNQGNQWLLTIGINNYLHWPRLRTAVNDAKEIKQVLVSKYGFSEENVVELYDADATREKILAQFRSLAGKVKEDDTLVIFYAGHGHVDDITGMGSWIPVESRTDNDFAWVTNDRIKNYLRIDAIRARHVLLISDSCFSGDFFRASRGLGDSPDADWIQRAFSLPSRKAITSGGLEPVSDGGFDDHSVFSYFLLKLLNDNDRNLLLPSSIFPQLRDLVASNSSQVPGFGSLQGIGGGDNGEMVLFLEKGKEIENEIERMSAEYARLQELHEEQEEARRKEDDIISAKERALTALSAEIDKLRKELDADTSGGANTLDSYLAVIEQKEVQAKELEALKRQREAEEMGRKEELARLQKEKEQQFIAGLRANVEKYERIVSSEHGTEYQKAAWEALVKNLPGDWREGVEEGDTVRLLKTPQERDQEKEKARRRFAAKNAEATRLIKEAELEARRSGPGDGFTHGLTNIFRALSGHHPPHDTINTGFFYYLTYGIGLIASIAVYWGITGLFCFGIYGDVREPPIGFSIAMFTALGYMIWCVFAFMLTFYN